MKSIIKSLVLSLVLTQTACSVFVPQTESRVVESFTALKVSGLAEVIITQSDRPQLFLEVSGMPMSDVITKVVNNTLIITTKGFHSGESAQVFVHYNQLNSIAISGAAQLIGTNILNTQQLTITTDNAGDIKNLAIKADTLVVKINGAGNAHLKVEVESIDIEMNNSGDLNVQGVAKRQNVRSNSSRGTLSNTDLAYSK
jgi:hypothetical protein